MVRIVSSVNAEVVEEEPLGQSVEHVFLGNFDLRVVLAGPGCHGLEFRESRLPRRRVTRTMGFDEFLEQIRPFENDTAARGLLRQFAEIGQECGL